MHGKLSKTDIHGVHGKVSVCDVAKGTSAHQVGAVGKVLHGNTGLVAQSGENRLRCAVGSVAGAVLDDNTAVHDGTVSSIGILGMVGMDGMGIVSADKEAVGNGGAFVAT